MADTPSQSSEKVKVRLAPEQPATYEAADPWWTDSGSQFDRDRWLEDSLPLLDGIGPLLPGAADKSPAVGKEWQQAPGWSLTRLHQKEPECICWHIGADDSHVGVDVDGAKAAAFCQSQGCDPYTADTWRIIRTSNTERVKLVFTVTPEQKATLMGGAKTVKIEGQELAVFAKPGIQIVVLGNHYTKESNFTENDDQYAWAGRAPAEAQPMPPEWFDLLTGVFCGERPLRPPTRRAVTASSTRKANSYSCSSGKWINSSTRQPCPICGRDHSGACSIHADGKSVWCCHGETKSAPDCGRDGEKITGRGDGRVWGYVRTEEHDSFGERSLFVLHKPRQQAQQTSTAQQTQQLKPASAPTPAPAPDADPDSAPYRVLGWCADRSRIYYQHRQTGQIASIKPSAAAGPLLQLAPIGWWEAYYPKKNELSWAAACSAVIEQANRAGVFAVDRVRGRGLWIDGKSVIWHLGDRLEVDGKEVALIEHRSANHYPRLPGLDIDRTVVPLTDAEGREILAAVAAMGWATPLDHIHLLGWAALANVGGALEKRPVLQITSHYGSGKSHTKDHAVAPLLAGLAISRSNSSEAGIRQILKADTLPVLLDESEGEDRTRREGHLRLARLSYDGSPTDRGTTHGEALTYAIRSSIALVGINAEINSPAERSRTVVVGRVQLPQEAWAAVDRRLRELLTDETGARLLRRTVTHLHTLRANVATFRRAVESQLGGGAAARAGATYGALLAGAHMLTNTALVDDETALGWLDSISWSAIAALGDAGADGQDAAAESRQCLAHLLAHEEPWRLVNDERGTGRISVRELIGLARLPSGSNETAEARKALGRRGIRASDCGLEIANTPETLETIYGKTKWCKGAHRARLLDLPGAYAAGSVRFQGLGSVKACKVPWEVLG